MMRGKIPFLFLVFLIAFGIHSAKSESLLGSKWLSSGRVVASQRVISFSVVKASNLKCEPNRIRARVLKLNGSGGVALLRIVSETYRGLLFTVNVPASAGFKEGDYVNALLCREQKEIAFVKGR